MRKVQKKVEEMKRIILGLCPLALLSGRSIFFFFFFCLLGVENVQLDEKDQSLFERISKQILQNLRIRVEDFHFAYQTESTSKLGHPFAFGLTFQSVQLVVRSCLLLFFSVHSLRSSLQGEKFDPSKSKSKAKSKGLKETSIVYSVCSLSLVRSDGEKREERSHRWFISVR